MLFIDSRMRNFEKEKLIELGYVLYEIPQNPILYSEISGHCDIHLCKIKDTIIFEPSLNLNKFEKGNSQLQSKYPLDIQYNVCAFGNFAIHNFKYTDTKIIEFIEKYNLQKINISQGYSKCSIAVIDDNSVIVTDTKIAKILTSYKINVLLINKEILDNIKLLNSQNTYSQMHGFIGGCISRIDNYIFVSGDLKIIDSNNLIKQFIEERNLKIIDFPNQDIIDYGGIIKE